MTTAPIITPPKERTAPPSPANGHETTAPKPEAPAPPIDVKTLSRASLAALLAAAQRETELLAEQDRNDALAAMSKAFHIPIPRLKATIERESAAPQPRLQPHAKGDGTDGRYVVKPKYRDPADPTAKRTWSGRGQAPAWIEYGDEIDPKTGKKLPLAKFRIPDDEGAV
jgi:DNA-binding protein H-NS